MKAVLQRVSSASVTVDDRTIGRIGIGLLALVAVEPDDGPADVQYIASKIRDLRVFPDPDDRGKAFDRALQDVGAAVLVVSQFTIAADCRKGRRPSLDGAAAPHVARPLYEDLVRVLRESGVSAETGEFQATMQVALVNDGPVTLLLDSRKRF